MKIREVARRWWLVGLGGLLGIAAGLAVVAVTPKSYTATATLFVGSPASTDASVAYNLDLFSQQRALTYAKLAQSRDIAVAVQSDLGVPITLDELAAKVTAVPVLKTVLMKISATDGSPEFASEIANTFASDFTKYVTRLETPEGSNQSSTAVTVIQRAEPPSSPSSPNVVWNLLIGLVGGIASGFFAKWLFRFFDHRARTIKQVADATAAPALGTLPKDSARRVRRLDLAADSTSAYAEALRRIRANLLYVEGEAAPKTIAFVATTSSTSTTAVATNLAVVLDGAGRRVSLVDADLRQSRVTHYVGDSRLARTRGGHGGHHHHQAGPGDVEDLTTVLSGDVELDSAVSRVTGTGIDVLVAASSSSAAGEILASDALVKLIADLRSRYDFVFCDTPGYFVANDGVDVGRLCDGVVLVATQGKTRLDQLSEMAATLRNLGAQIIGVVLTEAR